MRKVPFEPQVVRADEVLGLAWGAKAEPFQLQGDDDGIVVIGLQQADAGRCCAGLGVEFGAIHRPAAAHLHRVIRVGVVAFNGAAQMGVGEAEVASGGLVHH